MEMIASLRRVYRRRVPRQIRLIVGRPLRGAALAVALKLLRVKSLRPPARWHLRLIRYGWGNSGSAASEAYLVAIVEACSRVTGPVFEVGSGVSTLVAAATLRDRRIPLLALEHMAEWSERVRRAAAGFDVSVMNRPLVAHQGFDWYSVEAGEIPDQVQLVICDGPPGTTRGGRYGLLPVARERLAPGALVLLDDAARFGEREVLSRWATEFHTIAVVESGECPFARVVVP